MKIKLIIFCGLVCGQLAICLIGSTIDSPQIKWKFETGASIRGTALLDQDKIYFGNSNGTIYCLKMNNAEPVWKFESGSTITSQPVVVGDDLLVSSRGNRMYSFKKDNGDLKWSFALDDATPHKYGWDYLDASPVVAGGFVIISSGENKLHALSLADGHVIWEFESGDKIRATPLFHEGVLYVPCYNGVLYKLSANDGSLMGSFQTDGIKYYDQINAWDRTALMGRPALANGTLVLGSRDGGLYGLDANTLEKKWRSTYGSTWVASYPVIDEDRVYVGWSDKRFITAMDLETGEEIWKYTTDGIVFSDPILDAENLYIGSYDGSVYCLRKETGKLVWKYQTDRAIISSPILSENELYVGNDDGTLFAFEHTKSIKAVYQPVEENLPGWRLSSDKIAPYLEAKNFQRLDASSLGKFLEDRIHDLKPSVVVFAHPYFSRDITGANSGHDLFREYMESGGRIIWLFVSPNKFLVDDNMKLVGRNDDYAKALWGVEFDINSDWASYYSKATEEGLKWGLPVSSLMKSALFPETSGIVPLAYTELGRIAAFYKHFGGRPNSGFVFMRSWNKTPKQRDLELILALAEHEL